MTSDLTLPAGYAELLKEVKERVRAAQVRAGLAANRELMALYWDIGRMILDRQAAEGWGAKVIDRLSRDLHAAFPGQQGFSPRNLKYMRAFADAWPDPQFVQQPAAQIPWTHHCMLLDKVQTPADRLWYAAKAIENGWSRNILALQIQSALHTRQGRAVSNFPATLPPPQSDLAQQITKDPYLFDFLNLVRHDLAICGSWHATPISMVKLCGGPWRAIRATFDRRGTPIPDGVPFGLTEDFVQDRQKQIQWRAFLARNALEPVSLAEVLDLLRRFPDARAERGEGRWLAGWSLAFWWRLALMPASASLAE